LEFDNVKHFFILIRKYAFAKLFSKRNSARYQILIGLVKVAKYNLMKNKNKNFISGNVQKT